jgi:hypothetical protein
MCCSCVQKSVTVTNVIERVGGLFPNIAYRWMKLDLASVLVSSYFFFPLINRKREREKVKRSGGEKSTDYGGERAIINKSAATEEEERVPIWAGQSVNENRVAHSHSFPFGHPMLMAAVYRSPGSSHREGGVVVRGSPKGGVIH